MNLLMHIIIAVLHHEFIVAIFNSCVTNFVIVMSYCHMNNYVSFYLAAIFNELQSDDGIIDIIEGLPFSDVLFVRGFSYGPIPIRISTLTYSEYEARGFNLEDDFNTSVIPIDAADGK